MDDKEAQSLHNQWVGRKLGEELVFTPAGSKLKEMLTEADLIWLTDEISKRLAERIRSSVGVRVNR